MSNPFQSRVPHVADNTGVRTPQREAYARLEEHAQVEDGEREVGIILPVGCGKSGCIALTPFAFRANRVLVVAPGVDISSQLQSDFDPTNDHMFYLKSGALMDGPYPEPVEIRGTSTNIGDLEEAHVVLTNIQQLQGSKNRWLERLPTDFFDLILFDEGHHNVATSWEVLKAKFPDASIVNFSATPLRADGQLMAGKIVYSYPIFRAIHEGYVKRLKAVVLNPRTLRYVRRKDAKEIEVSLDEVRRLGEEDADFRRSIVTSHETLCTIVDASIRQLQSLRLRTGEKRLKIIASALNFDHCRQIVEAYQARGLRADYVHSREEAPVNRKVLKKLENHELDVIVQVRKLGEGFDHPYLAVAAVFSVFSNLSPFVQFVGRIMRVIEQNAPGHPLNNGVVVFHAGANVARRWEDFQNYSEADREFFDQLLPLEGLDFGSSEELEIEPTSDDFDGELVGGQLEIRAQEDVQLEEIPLIKDDPEALAALKLLKEKGYTRDQVGEAFDNLKPVPVTKVRERQAKRRGLDTRVMNETAKILKKRRVNPEGHDLDYQRLNRTNLIVLKSAIDRQIQQLVGRKKGERHEYTRQELEQINVEFGALVERAVKEVFNAKN
jgi:superfamily II DNA or RNA helicase